MATELDILKHAEMYLRKLACEVDPLDDSLLPEGDVCKQERISKCLVYAADNLQTLANRKERREQKFSSIPFDLNQINLTKFKYCSVSISLKEMANRINILLPKQTVLVKERDLKYQLHLCRITGKRLNDQHYVEDYITKKGVELGFTIIKSKRNRKEMTIILCSPTAQHFILENIHQVQSLTNQRREIALAKGGYAIYNQRAIQ